MQNQAGRSVPGTLERDHLVQSINQIKPDKKTHLKVQAMALNGSTGNEIYDQAQEQHCQYVLFTSLTELRAAGDPYQRRPGTFETNPNGTWTTPNSPQAQAQEPEYRATVDYKLYRVAGHEEIGGAPFSNQQAMPETAVVSQIMDRIANRAVADIRKGPAPMRE